jgi:hypothetical protein
LLAAHVVPHASQDLDANELAMIQEAGISEEEATAPHQIGRVQVRVLTTCNTCPLDYVVPPTIPIDSSGPRRKTNIDLTTNKRRPHRRNRRPTSTQPKTLRSKIDVIASTDDDEDDIDDNDDAHDDADYADHVSDSDRKQAKRNPANIPEPNSSPTPEQLEIAALKEKLAQAEMAELQRANALLTAQLAAAAAKPNNTISPQDLLQITEDMKQLHNATSSKFQAAVITATDATTTTAQAIVAATQAAHDAASKQAAAAAEAQQKLVDTMAQALRTKRRYSDDDDFEDDRDRERRRRQRPSKQQRRLVRSDDENEPQVRALKHVQKAQSADLSEEGRKLMAMFMAQQEKMQEKMQAQQEKMQEQQAQMLEKMMQILPRRNI